MIRKTKRMNTGGGVKVPKGSAPTGMPKKVGRTAGTSLKGSGPLKSSSPLKSSGPVRKPSAAATTAANAKRKSNAGLAQRNAGKVNARPSPAKTQKKEPAKEKELMKHRRDFDPTDDPSTLYRVGNGDFMPYWRVKQSDGK